MDNRFSFKEIEYEDTKDFILNKHYAQRMPSITYSYGLFEKDELIGVLTIGKPASNSLCEGVCGAEYKQYVYELNRLVVIEGLPRNTLSWFVGGVLRDLRDTDLIIVSYADEGMGHNGYVYQATNWLYTGKTPSRTDKYTPKGRHSRHYSDEHLHLRKVRTSKHRYIYFTGRSRRKHRKLLNYKVQPYPKGENERYVLGDRMQAKIINRDTGETWWE